MKRMSRQPVDWETLRGRLSRASVAIDSTIEVTPEAGRQIMEERARLIAQPIADESRAADEIEVVSFELAAELHAIETRFVIEVLPFVDFTRVPRATDMLIGATTFRGEILPVFDIRPLFGVPSAALTDMSRLLVLGVDSPDLGIAVDRIGEVTRLSRRELHDSASRERHDGASPVLGVTSGALIAIDGAALLRDPRLFCGSEA